MSQNKFLERLPFDAERATRISIPIINKIRITMIIASTRLRAVNTMPKTNKIIPEIPGATNPGLKSSKL